jgi:hypothetical protein
MNIVIIVKLRRALAKQILRENAHKTDSGIFTLSQREQQRRKAKKGHEYKMTMLLISVLSSFAVLTTPNTILSFISIQGAGQFYVNESFQNHLIAGIFDIMLTCNYALNFYLYCFSNR